MSVLYQEESICPDCNESYMKKAKNQKRCITCTNIMDHKRLKPKKIKDTQTEAVMRNGVEILLGAFGKEIYS
jgi:tRNA(Ile2) C34 agmatinyltransferase TiaS